jgi:hypothetical protein
MLKLHPSAYVVALATVAIHLAVCHRFGYYRDELYFIDCAKHLAWGYVDQPPLVPFLTWLTAPLGYPVWALRAFPALLSGVTILLSCAIVRELRGNGFAQALTAIVVAMAPGLAGIAYGVSTEMFSPAAWTALFYCTVRLINTRDTRWYYAIAAVLVVGLYAKYSIAACALAIVVALLLTGEGALLRSRRLGVATAIVVLLAFPNAIWQIGHGFPMLEVLHDDQLTRHALANGMADESPNRWVNALFMFGLQFAYQNPIFSLVWIWGLVYAWQTRPYRFVTVAYLVLLCLLVLTIGRGYYIQGCYPALFAIGAVAIERTIAKRRTIEGAVLAAAFIVGLPMLPLAVPVLPLRTYMAYEREIGLSRPEPPDGKSHLINPMYADQLGWKTMTQTVAGAYWSLPAPQRRMTAVFADRYAYAGALDYYGPRYGLPPVISPNNSYYLWGTRGYSGRSMLAVGATDYWLLLHWFGSVRQIAVYRNDLRWMLEGPLPIYLCTKPRAPLAAMWPAFKYYGL